jgi:hypothetical protein
MAVGDEFFEPNPESSLTHFVFKLNELKAYLSDARSALSTLSGEELRTKAHDLGRMDSLSCMLHFAYHTCVGHQLRLYFSTEKRTRCSAVP